MNHPETAHVFQIDTPARLVAGMVFKPWDERYANHQPACSRSSSNELNDVAGARIAAFQLPPLPGSQGLPVQFVLETTDAFDRLNDRGAKLSQGSGQQRNVHFPRQRSQDRHAGSRPCRSIATRPRNSVSSMSDVGAALGGMLGGGYVNYFSLDQRSYKVIPQVQQGSRLNTQQLLELLRRHRQRRANPAVDGGDDHDQDDAGVDQSLSAAQQRDDPGRCGAGRSAGRRAEVSAGSCRARAAAGLFGRLRRPVAAICPGIERLRRHLRLCAHYHLSGARGPVRKLPRSGDHSSVGANVDCRRAAFHQRRHRRGDV